MSPRPAWRSTWTLQPTTWSLLTDSDRKNGPPSGSPPPHVTFPVVIWPREYGPCPNSMRLMLMRTVPLGMEISSTCTVLSPKNSSGGSPSLQVRGGKDPKILNLKNLRAEF